MDHQFRTNDDPCPYSGPPTQPGFCACCCRPPTQGALESSHDGSRACTCNRHTGTYSGLPTLRPSQSTASRCCSCSKDSSTNANKHQHESAVLRAELAKVRSRWNSIHHHGGVCFVRTSTTSQSIASRINGVPEVLPIDVWTTTSARSEVMDSTSTTPQSGNPGLPAIHTQHRGTAATATARMVPAGLTALPRRRCGPHSVNPHTEASQRYEFRPTDTSPDTPLGGPVRKDTEGTQRRLIPFEKSGCLSLFKNFEHYHRPHSNSNAPPLCLSASKSVTCQTVNLNPSSWRSRRASPHTRASYRLRVKAWPMN